MCHRPGNSRIRGLWSRHHLYVGEASRKSLFCKILPINPLTAIFCGQFGKLSLCFQYFAGKLGEGVLLDIAPSSEQERFLCTANRLFEATPFFLAERAKSEERKAKSEARKVNCEPRGAITGAVTHAC